MASSSLDMIWKVMSEHHIEDCIGDHAFLHCTLCHGLMINAYVSNCGCQFCKSCLEKLLENGAANCPSGRRDCSLQALVINEDVFPDHSSNIKISKLKVLCPNKVCDCVVEMTNLEEHLRVCSVLEDEYSIKIIESEEIVPSKILDEVIENLKDELNFIKEELKRNELKMEKDKMVFMEQLTETSKNNEEKIEELQRFVRDYCSSRCRSVVRDIPQTVPMEEGRQRIGEMLWRVDYFSEKAYKAKILAQLSSRSERFLSHKRGYTLCLVIYPNGCDFGEGTHLYIGFNIMKGEFDDELPWPFKGSVTISLVDQITEKKMFVRKYSYDTVGKKGAYKFDKPVKWCNHCCGVCQLIGLSRLYETPSLLMNDSLLVHGSVDRTGVD